MGRLVDEVRQGFCAGDLRNGLIKLEVGFYDNHILREQPLCPVIV